MASADNSGSTPGDFDREAVALQYIEQLPWPPYPFQEECILAWCDDSDGLMVCAPTGTGKTVIAETALFEALQAGKRAYYTTPLIALTEQKFGELQDSVERWGYSRDDVGLVTGNRKMNPDARILVVVAEILLNRLLSPEEFEFDDVSAVVMDEFHSFNDPERGIVWELSLGLLPKNVRLLLISATVGNAVDFTIWLHRRHSRRLRLLQSEIRRVPLDFRWIPDQLLTEQVEIMAAGSDEARYTPSLIFCFNRDECWSVAVQLKGKRLLAEGQQKRLSDALDHEDLSDGAGGKLKQILIRGVGIHHAGLLPKYRRLVERLFQQKLLSVCVCTETLAAGINLPARSVLMTSLLKGPRGKKKVIDASSAHQMFGRAGRPQFDNQGYVFAVAHDDDVKIHRWQEKLDQIPEKTKDPMLIRARKNLKKKMPKRRDGEQYWSEAQFQNLRQAPPAKLASRGRFPWRLLAWLIRKSGDVRTLTDAIHRRLLTSAEVEAAEIELIRRLRTLEAAGFIELIPPPPKELSSSDPDDSGAPFHSVMAESGRIESGRIDGMGDSELPYPSQSVWLNGSQEADEPWMSEVVEFGSSGDEDSEGFGDGIFEGDGSRAASTSKKTRPEKQPQATEEQPEEGRAAQSPGLLGQLISEARATDGVASTRVASSAKSGPDGAKPKEESSAASVEQDYSPRLAVATEQLPMLFAFRSVNSLYAVYVAEHLQKANGTERLQLLESMLEIPGSVARRVRIPFPDRLPLGPLSLEYANSEILSRGLATQEQLQGYRDPVTERFVPPLSLPDKMLSLFHSEYPGVRDFRISPVWCIGDLLQFNGDFSRFVHARDLVTQEGILFRHCLRMILLCGEFAAIEPPGIDPAVWRRDLNELAALLTQSCRGVDPDSTEETLSRLRQMEEQPEEVV